MDENISCHLWNDLKITADDLRSNLIDIREYVDESHLIRKLKRCKQCGQLYFYQFLEEVDWAGGEDAQYRIWIPVEDLEKAEAMNAVSDVELMSSQRLAEDWPTGTKEPLPIQKIG